MNNDARGDQNHSQFKLCVLQLDLSTMISHTLPTTIKMVHCEEWYESDIAPSILSLEKKLNEQYLNVFALRIWSLLGRVMISSLLRIVRDLWHFTLNFRSKKEYFFRFNI